MTGKDNDQYRSSIRSALEEKETDELLEIWRKHDRSEWTDEAFDTIQIILRERGEFPLASSEGKKYCLQCGTEIIPHAKFCFKCGDYQLDYCLVCNQPIPDDSKYCPFCGNVIKYQTNASKIFRMEALHDTVRWGLIAITVILLWIAFQLTSW